MNYLTAEQVLFIHSRLIGVTGGAPGVRDVGLLLSALSRPKATFEGKDLYPDVFHKAAALFESLVKNILLWTAINGPPLPPPASFSE